MSSDHRIAQLRALLIAGLHLALPIIACVAEETPTRSDATHRKTTAFTQEDIAAFRDEYSHGSDLLGAFIKGSPPILRTREEMAEERRLGRGFALRVLGQARVVERRSDIVRNLTYYYPGSAWNEGRYALTDFPAVDALVKMGSHAYDALYSRLGEPCSELDIALIVHIVLNVDGRELGICRLKIKQRGQGAEEDGTPFAKNLSRVLAIFDDEELPREKYSPVLIYREGQTNPKLLEAEPDDG